MTHHNWSEHYPNGYDFDANVGKWYLEIDMLSIQIPDGRVFKVPGTRRRYDIETGNLINTGYVQLEDLQIYTNGLKEKGAEI